MAVMPTSLFWIRTDMGASDHALVNDHAELSARGTAQAAAPLPYTCRYEVITDESWATSRLIRTDAPARWTSTWVARLAGSSCAAGDAN